MRTSRLWSNESLRALLLALVLLLSSVLSVITSASDVNAATPYDNLLEKANSLELADGGGKEDISTTYVGVMEQACGTSIKNSFMSAVDHEDGRWAIVESEWTLEDSNIESKTVSIGWSTDSQHDTNFVNVGFNDWYTITVDVENYIQLEYNNGYYNCQNFTSASEMTLAHTCKPHECYPANKIFLSTYPVVYPSGYTGVQIPDTFTPQAQVRPAFTYEVNNKHVSVKHEKEFDHLPSYPDDDYRIEYTLFECKGGLEDTLCNDPEVVNYEVGNKGEQVKFDVSKYGDYMMEMGYLVGGCTRYESYPATPDYCYFTEPETSDEYAYLTSTVPMKIDGSVFSGDTRNQNCDVAGFCEPLSPYEDCSVHGVDIVAGIGCHFRNFGVFLGITLRNLFVPSAAYFEQFWQRFNDFWSQKLGFVYQSISVLVGFITGVVSQASTTTCSISPDGEIFGAEFSVDVCAFQNMAPAIFTAIQVFIIGATVLMLCFAGVRKYQEVLGRR